MVNNQRYNNIMNEIKVASKARQNYIEEHGIYPEYELGNAAYYKRTKKLLALLEDLNIQESFKNRQN